MYSPVFLPREPRGGKGGCWDNLPVQYNTVQFSAVQYSKGLMYSPVFLLREPRGGKGGCDHRVDLQTGLVYFDPPVKSLRVKS